MRLQTLKIVKIKLIIQKNVRKKSSAADPAEDPDLDLACNFDADPDPDPTVYFNADPNPDPSFQIKALNFK